MEEIWKPIPSTHGYYEASSIGKIRRCIAKPTSKNWRNRHRECLKLTPWKHGYLVATFTINAKRFKKRVHNMVLEAFVGACPIGLQGAHLNGNKLDNRIENLKWVTAKENQSHRKMHGTDTHTIVKKRGYWFLKDA